MSSVLIHHIGLLAGVHAQSRLLKGEMLRDLPCLENAWLLAKDGRIAAFGTMEEDWRTAATGAIPQSVAAGPIPQGATAGAVASFSEVDAKGATVLPCWCDSHTHLVFAGSRETEFVDKLKGLTYAEIAARGGGILHSANLLRETPEDILYAQAWRRLQECMKLGTGAIEIKSGYGLSVESELKMLRVIRRLKQHAPIPVKATFLGAHAFPAAYKEDHAGYVRLVIEDMLPRIAAEGLADYIDVFCEEGFFSSEQTRVVCEAGIRHGLRPKIHANQLHLSGGVQVGVQVGALSVDHLETCGDEEIECLRKGNTIATLLPGAAFFLRMGYPPARAMIEAGLPIALASDYNPGSCPSGNMNLVVSMGCVQMKLLPEEGKYY